MTPVKYIELIKTTKNMKFLYFCTDILEYNITKIKLDIEEISIKLLLKPPKLFHELKLKRWVSNKIKIEKILSFLSSTKKIEIIVSRGVIKYP